MGLIYSKNDCWVLTFSVAPPSSTLHTDDSRAEVSIVAEPGLDSLLPDSVPWAPNRVMKGWVCDALSMGHHT